MRPLLSLAAFLIALASAPAGAATIVKEPGNGQMDVIRVSGPIAPGDDARFMALAVRTKGRALVMLDGPGGSIKSALSIGAQIRERNFVTAVDLDTTCTSACALIWLGGERRYMASSARVGFHAAYVEEAKGKRESGSANALVGAYLNMMGLPIGAIAYVTEARPEEIKWLSLRDAAALGIKVLTVDESSPEP